MNGSYKVTYVHFIAVFITLEFGQTTYYNTRVFSDLAKPDFFFSVSLSEPANKH